MGRERAMMPAAPAINPSLLRLLFGSVASVVGAGVILLWRVRETTRPLTTRAIVIPPLAMSTGVGMFAVPAMRVPPLWGLAAFAAGALLLSQPLIRTSHLERRGDRVMMRRSRAFLAVLFVLVVLRLALRRYLDHHISPLQTAALFYLLAFGMIVCWRAWMFVRYRELSTAPAGT
jgi:membrane protein CcdC involved in cytochrome C biogenesis